MKRFLVLIGMVSLVFAMSVATASATPSKTTRCSGCHSGAAPAVTATLATPIAGPTATYNVSAGGANYIAVFNGTTKVTQIAGSSGSVTLPTGVTYTLYAVTGPSTSDGLATLTLVVPTAPVITPPTAPTLNSSYNTNVNNITISWAAVSGATSYDYQVGGGAVQSTTGTSVTVSNLTLGTTTFKLRATNSGGSSTYVNANIVYVIAAPAAPVLQPNYNTASNSIIVSWTAVAGAASYEYVLNSGPVQNTAGTSAMLSGLVLGDNTLQMRAVNSGGVSSWASSVIVYSIPVPAKPVLNTAYDTSSDSITISWNAVSGATGYEYIIGNGVIQNITTTSVTLNNLVPGATSFQLRSVNQSGSSEWASAVVTFTIPIIEVPAAPVLNSSYSSNSSSYTLVWNAVPGATGYRVSLNGGEAVTVAVPSINLTGLVNGGNSITIVAFNEGGDSPAAAAIINFVPAPPTTIKTTKLTLRVSDTTVKLGSKIDFRGTLMNINNLGLGGRTVILQRWTGTHWVALKSTTTRAGGGYKFEDVKMSVRGSIKYRTVFAGSKSFTKSISNSVTVKVSSYYHN